MSEYISKESIVTLLEQYGYIDKEMERDLASIPSADVRRNIHAAWEDTADPIDSRWGRKYYQCPKCSKRADYFMGGSEDWWCVDKPNFCPSCGAIMDGEPIGEKGET